MSSKSMIDAAYEIMSRQNNSMPFLDLYKKVSEEMGYNETQFEDNIAQCYTDLSLDSRFLNLEGNNWDLKKRHTYSESVMDTDAIAIDEDEDDE
ncbi:DNA-directed RNA polymerase subunit delta [Catenisphaera adipataccumulans]|jgi:DNA-directed RNA polymerase subunit delta|uniref:RNAP delta factor n=1 Tax=Catenisphaera adipataccumulans TaxID=700500 RepID=A0A7W8D1I4_9FIRM|nr:DNA-directed RNA polymerase subunit delta [Catenisphaera adipataccumulans]MBB5183860.1 DNA-directed RNA polymerase subunit delta [Catenisphaera adipataccumulans]